jgi:hypothetical protein
MRLIELLFFFLAGLSQAGYGDSLRFYYTANRQGEIDPCGCPTTEQNGGINRMAAFLAAAKYNPETAFFGDAGDTFFSNPSLLPTRKASELGKSKVIAAAYREMGVQIFSPGERDFANGVDGLKALQAESGVTFISANLKNADGSPIFPAYLLVKKQGLKIGVVGLADPNLFQAPYPTVVGVRADPPAPALTAALKALHEQGADVIVLLSHLGLSGDREIAKVEGIDLIIGAHSLDSLDPPQKVGNTWIVQPMYQGEQIGYLDFDLSARRFTAARLVDLGRDWDRENKVSQLVSAYKQKRHDAVLDEVPVRRAATRVSNAFVAHPESCRGCHAKQYDFWETTKHASAYLALYAKDEHFNPECIGCHSLGYGQKGGYSSIVAPIAIKGKPAFHKGTVPFIEKIMKSVFAEDTGALDSRLQPERFSRLQHRYLDEIHRLETEGKVEHLYAGVQCENCHGNLNGHPADHRPVAKIVEKTCRGCHRPPQAPGFNFEMVKIVGCPAGKS